ncbi:MAG: hypothetical protein ACI9XO_003531 [Paraglaciecola sp.]|jgi:hypothetical protein
MQTFLKGNKSNIKSIGMKKITTLLFFLLSFVLLPETIKAAASPTRAIVIKKSIFDLNAEDIIKYNQQELGSKFGRNLKFLKKKLKKKNRKKIAKTNERSRPKNLAIAGFVLGILGFVLIAIAPILFLVFSILAIVFSSIALNEFKQNPEVSDLKWMAIAGLVLGIIGLAVVFIVIVVVLLFISSLL